MQGLTSFIDSAIKDIGTNYIEFSNGLLIQWGSAYTYTNSLSALIDVNLPKQYTDKKYKVFVSLGHNSSCVIKYNVSDGMGDNDNRTQSKFTVNVKLDTNTKYSINIFWLTIGF